MILVHTRCERDLLIMGVHRLYTKIQQILRIYVLVCEYEIADMASRKVNSGTVAWNKVEKRLSQHNGILFSDHDTEIFLNMEQSEELFRRRKEEEQLNGFMVSVKWIAFRGGSEGSKRRCLSKKSRPGEPPHKNVEPSLA